MKICIYIQSFGVEQPRALPHVKKLIKGMLWLGRAPAGALGRIPFGTKVNVGFGEMCS